LSTLLLKQALFVAYSGFADQRFKDLNKASLFIVDYRRTGDTNPKVYGNSCLIFADVIAPRQVRVALTNTIPRGASLSDWARTHSIPLLDDQPLVFSITPTSTDDLRSLASAFRAIVARGKRYAAAHYKYSCPATAASLEKLAIVLDEAWSATDPAKG
jgi:hypothetical protein